MLTLEPLRPDHADALLAFERARPPASMAVLTHNAFTVVEEFLLDDRPALRYRRSLA
ncbi:hypothetical protein ABTY61_18800 [Kitasatospora sp. NPDC096128]|uniref:hypothetical protein n=1 Tax=Kitasatospora sp. NPDC096128 TaxID=3155547 RepID=UPI00332CBDE5